MDKQAIYERIESHRERLIDSCRFIWHHPEVGGTEKESSAYLRGLLKDEGFRIQEVPEMPYAFVAEYGSGKPVIAILGEYDALPGLSQQTVSVKDPVEPGAPGHGCGHNLLGSASAVAAISLKEIMEEEQIPGTLRYYGCPEEELLIGKVKMVYYHLFDDVDVAMTWHPMTSTQVYDGGALANTSVRFFFKGTPSHAAVAPEKGRSALDAVELMNIGVNYLREHVIDKARIHYTTNSGGTPPNIVPAAADSWYYIRAPHISDVKEILGRIRKIAEGAALMTETQVQVQVESGCCEIRPNHALADLVQENLEAAPLPVYTKEELAFAKKLQASCDPAVIARDEELFDSAGSPMMDHVGGRDLYKSSPLSASTDAGDVSFVTPMHMFAAACWPIGTGPHTWQVAAANGTSLAEKGAMYAAKVLAASVYDLLMDEAVLQKVRAEFEANRDPDYAPMIFMKE